MAEDKNGFLLYKDLIHSVKKLPKDKAGELFLHILSYVNDENPETDDLLIELSFEPIKQALKRDLKKYEKTKEKNRENANKRWQKSTDKSEGIPNDATAYDRMPTDANSCEAMPLDAKHADIDSGSDIGSDSDTDSGIDILLEKETKEENIIKENSDSEFFTDVTPIQDLVQDAKEVLRLQEEEKRKKVPLKKEKIEPPDLETFIAFAREMYQNELKVDFSPYEFAVKAKYDSWNDADWKDGHKEPIVVWKNKLRNTIPHLKPIYGQSTRNNTSTGFNSGYGNTSGGFKASGKISGRTLLAREIDKQPSGNSQSGDFTINAEVVK